MSKTAAAEFLGLVRVDSGIRAALGTTPTIESYVEEGRRAGYEFSGDDLGPVINAEKVLSRRDG